MAWLPFQTPIKPFEGTLKNDSRLGKGLQSGYARLNKSLSGA